MIAVAILRRRLREGRTYEEFRKAWFHEAGFGVPNRMLTMLNVADPREVIVIGLTTVGSAEEGARLLAMDRLQRTDSPLDEIVESEIDRTFGILVAEDDFSGTGALQYHEAMVGGTKTSVGELEEVITVARSLLAGYFSHQVTEQRPE